MAVVVVRRAAPRRADPPATQASRQSKNEHKINHHKQHNEQTTKRRRRRRCRRHNLNEQQHDPIHRTPPATCRQTYTRTYMPDPAGRQSHTSTTTTATKYLLHTALPPAHPPGPGGPPPPPPPPRQQRCKHCEAAPGALACRCCLLSDGRPPCRQGCDATTVDFPRGVQGSRGRGLRESGPCHCDHGRGPEHIRQGRIIWLPCDAA